jgi:hypothetical protein
LRLPYVHFYFSSLHVHIRLMICYIELLRIRYYTSVFLSVYMLHMNLNSYSMAPNYSKERLQHKQNHRFINDSTDV